MTILDRHDIRRALVRGYCDRINHKKTIDGDLVDSMTDEVMLTVDRWILENYDGHTMGAYAAVVDALPDRRH